MATVQHPRGRRPRRGCAAPPTTTRTTAILLLLATAPLPSSCGGKWLERYNLRLKAELEFELDDVGGGNSDFAMTPEAYLFLDNGDGDDRGRARRGLQGSKTCSSPLMNWSADRIKEMGYGVYKELYDNKILQMPYIYKHYIDRYDHDESFGYDGAHTAELFSRHDATMSFWSEADSRGEMNTDGILLLSMHGADLKSNEKLVPTIMRMFEFQGVNDVLAFASHVQEYVSRLPDGFDNPLLTLNAVATRGVPASPYATHEIQDSIIIGDGVLRFLKDSGLDAAGPDFVHAHEFGHHLQFEADIAVPPSLGLADDVRRKELMADAAGGYFLAHDRGGDMGPQEIHVFHATAFSTGDCSTDSKDHHGTPRQRQCAAMWGASKAAPDANIIDAEYFLDMFDRALPKMLDLDPDVCALRLESTSNDGTAAAAASQGPAPAAKQEEEAQAAPPIFKAPPAPKEATGSGSTTRGFGGEGGNGVRPKDDPPQKPKIDANDGDKQYYNGKDGYTSMGQHQRGCDLSWIHCGDGYEFNDRSPSSLPTGGRSLLAAALILLPAALLLLG